MTILEGVLLSALVLLLFAIIGSLLFPLGIGRNDGRCGEEDLAVSKVRLSCIRSGWIDASF